MIYKMLIKLVPIHIYCLDVIKYEIFLSKLLNARFLQIEKKNKKKNDEILFAFSSRVGHIRKKKNQKHFHLFEKSLKLREHLLNFNVFVKVFLIKMCRNSMVRKLSWSLNGLSKL